MTFWAAFEAFVHLYSEVLALAKPTVPAAVKQALLEVEDYVGRDGEVLTRPRQRPVLDRIGYFSGMDTASITIGETRYGKLDRLH